VEVKNPIIEEGAMIDLRTCAFCLSLVNDDFLVKYSTRRYAHATCLRDRKGMNFILALPECPRKQALILLKKADEGERVAREEVEERDRRDQVQPVVEAICNVAMDDHETRSFLGLLNCEHRTRQQGFGRLVAAWIKQQAANCSLGRGYYDLRNEATVKMCREIVDKVDPNFLALPFI
jgi:hypothetical protein